MFGDKWKSKQYPNGCRECPEGEKFNRKHSGGGLCSMHYKRKPKQDKADIAAAVGDAHNRRTAAELVEEAAAAAEEAITGGIELHSSDMTSNFVHGKDCLFNTDLCHSHYRGNCNCNVASIDHAWSGPNLNDHAVGEHVPPQPVQNASEAEEHPHVAIIQAAEEARHRALSGEANGVAEHILVTPPEEVSSDWNTYPDEILLHGGSDAHLDWWRDHPTATLGEVFKSQAVELPELTVDVPEELAKPCCGQRPEGDMDCSNCPTESADGEVRTFVGVRGLGIVSASDPAHEIVQETQALQTVLLALESLPDESRARITGWAINRYDLGGWFGLGSAARPVPQSESNS